MIKHMDPQINEQSLQNSPIHVDLRDSVQENEEQATKFKPLFSPNKNQVENEMPQGVEISN